MNVHLDNIIKLLQASQFPEAEKQLIVKAVTDADKQWAITDFKLDRTEKVKRTTSILLEETIEELEQKRKAVEAQNKELEIETALERVRSVAMAMRKPGDLLNISKILFTELLQLGFAELRNALIGIFNDDQKYFTDYDYSDYSGGSITKIPYNQNPIIDRSLQQMKSATDAFTEFVVEGKELEEWKAFRKQNGEYDDARISSAGSLYYYFYSIDAGNIGLSTFKKIDEDQVSILKKFRNVFDLAYKRYVDISKAEAQARESQIQLALERVRARTMAMYKSEELSDLSLELVKQVQTLGVATWFCAFNINDEDLNSSIEWGSNGQGVFPKYRTPRENIFLRYYEAGKRGETLLINEIGENECPAHYEYLCSLPGVGDQLLKMREAGLSFPTHQIDHVAFFKYGYILFITYEPVPEMHDIFKRFAKVFEQTYTRFLDLQKAEAQTREAEIQLALERVRARTMAMQQSGELNEVSTILFNQLRSLGGSLWTTAIVLCNENSNEDEFRTAFAGGLQPSVFVPNNQDAVHIKMYEGWKNGSELLSISKEGNELKAHYDYMMTVPSIKDNFEKMLASGITFPAWQKWHAAYFTFGYLMIITTEPYHDEQIFGRFAKVFDQSYTRFLDLQKAEAQAKEGQIQLALERVRARTMAMQKSDELGAAASLLFEQVKALGIASYSSGFTVWENDDNELVSWMCNADGSINPPFRMPAADIEWHRQQYESWKKQEDYVVYDFTGEEMQEHYKYLRSFPLLNQAFETSEKAGVPTPLRQVHNAFNFSRGNLLFITLQPVPESFDIFSRFANVFDQTYTRFLDLKKAEAQAKESEIQLALERVRARTMAMQTSDELSEAVYVLFQQFRELGENPDQATIGIINEAENVIEYWVTMYGQQIKKVFKFSIAEPDVTNKIYKAWKENKQSIVIDLSGTALTDFMTYRANMGGAAVNPNEKRRIINVAFFSNGLLNVQSKEERSTASIRLLERFAAVFEQTYTRFLDLQKAEAQAREARIEGALEKVRSRTLAMQKSNELAETAAVLFQQLIALGIEPNRLYIAIVKNKKGAAEFWITDEDGTKISTAFNANLNDNGSFAKMFEGWQQQKKSVVIDMQGDELQAYFRHLTSLGVPFKDGLTQKKRVQDIAYFSKGFIGIASPDDQPQETLQLLERFAAVFNLTFTRFNDLQIAEAHAMQAEQDLIAIKEARQKAEAALTELQSAQKQLIQSEKMASLGELTAGIAHEIQNPLNFVNNFSEVSKELLEEMNEAFDKGDTAEAREIMNDVIENLQKINHHGKRADAIVKGMLQHSTSSSGVKEPTNINALCDEYLRLSYHGLRAKDKFFNATLKTDYDKAIGTIHIIPQDIGRVLLNLINNAFYAVNEKQHTQSLKPTGENETYNPAVSIITKKMGDTVFISVKDNGGGIPQKIIDKIFQPFFTTKPTGQGTGLGLSLSYDIIKAHGGELKVETKEGEGSTFIIKLSMNA